MNSKFEPHQQSMFNNSPEPMNTQGQSSADAFHGDRFELLSAYVDGEVTAAERKQVEEWLATDPTVQQLHSRLMKLRQAFRAMPSPAPVQPVEKTVEQVMAKLDRRPNLRLVWGGGAAIAAAVIGAVSLLAFRPSEQLARVEPKPAPIAVPAPQQTAENSDADGLLVALDKPVLAGMTAQDAGQKVPVKVNQEAH